MAFYCKRVYDDNLPMYIVHDVQMLLENQKEEYIARNVR